MLSKFLVCSFRFVCRGSALFCYALLCVLSSFAIILNRKRERAGCCAFIVLRMYCYCKFSVTLPHGVMGRCAVCDCAIS